MMPVFAILHSPPSYSGTRKQIIHLSRRCGPKSFLHAEHLPLVAASFLASSSAVIWPRAPIRRARELVPAARRRITVTSYQSAPNLLALSRLCLLVIFYQFCESDPLWVSHNLLGH